MFNRESLENNTFFSHLMFRKSLVDAIIVVVRGITCNMSLKEFLKEREGMFSTRSKCTCILLFYYYRYSLNVWCKCSYKEAYWSLKSDN